MTDITKIREYLEERLKEVEKEVVDFAKAHCMASGRLHELRRLIAALNEEDGAQSPSAESPSPPSPKPPREACADAIIEHYAGKTIPQDDHEMSPEAFAQLNAQWNPRTIRAGLAIARTRREGAAVLAQPKTESEVVPHRTATAGLDTATPPVASIAPGAHPLDPPSFLDRRGQRQG